MNGPILIFPVAGDVYLARNDRGLTAEGPTPEQALAKLREETDRYLVGHRQAMTTPPPDGDHPWLKWSGTRDPNDPLIQEWWKAVEEYRAARDAEPGGF